MAIFFVISGFLLYLPYARVLRHASKLPSWRTYAQRRAVRIVPAYWLVLTVIAATSFGASIIKGSWWRYYGLTQIYDRSTVAGGLPVAWSLCVEVTFYLMLPFLALLAARLGASQRVSGRYMGQAVLIGGLAIGSLGAPRAALRTGDRRGPPARAAAGHLVARLSRLVCVGDGARGLLERMGGPVGRVGLAATVRRPAGPQLGDGGRAVPARPHRSDRSVPSPLRSLAVFVDRRHPLLARGASGRRRPRPSADPVVASPLAVWLGTISYGNYLLHVPVIEAINGSITVPPKRLPPFKGRRPARACARRRNRARRRAQLVPGRTSGQALPAARPPNRPARRRRPPVAGAPWAALVQADLSNPNPSTSRPDYCSARRSASGRRRLSRNGRCDRLTHPSFAQRERRLGGIRSSSRPKAVSLLNSVDQWPIPWYAAACGLGRSMTDPAETLNAMGHT